MKRYVALLFFAGLHTCGAMYEMEVFCPEEPSENGSVEYKPFYVRAQGEQGTLEVVETQIFSDPLLKKKAEYIPQNEYPYCYKAIADSIFHNPACTKVLTVDERFKLVTICTQDKSFVFHYPLYAFSITMISGQNKINNFLKENGFKKERSKFVLMKDKEERFGYKIVVYGDCPRPNQLFWHAFGTNTIEKIG